MKGFHVIAGLPRSGSTLLANLLNQNPEFHASSTSSVAGAVQGLQIYWSNSLEVKSSLANDPRGTESRSREALRGLIEGWYSSREDQIVFDKGRQWVAVAGVLADIYSEARIFAMVRDPREVCASILRAHEQSPIFDLEPGATVLSRASNLFHTSSGIVGGAMTWLEDHHRRKTPNVVVLPFEQFVADPEDTLRTVYAKMKMDYWDGHDFSAVESTATDCDAQYLNKFPHHYDAKPVESKDPTWPRVVPSEIAQNIVNTFPAFFKAYGYN